MATKGGTASEKSIKNRAFKDKLYWAAFDDVPFPERMNALPDDTLLTSAEAAVFLDISPATLDRMVSDIDAPLPKRIGRGATAPRMYLKEDLLKYQRKLGNPLGALPKDQRKIRRFSDISDLAMQLPYYLDEFQRVVGLVGNQSMGVVIEQLGKWQIVWLNAIDATSRTWSNLGEHRKRAREVSKVLNQSKRVISAGLEGTEIAEGTKLPTDEPDSEGKSLGPL